MIKLPKLFEETLSKNPNLLADVQKTLNQFEPWLEQSGMPFFPGFTDHSPRHINDVLSTASSLISDSAHDLLSPEDIAVLTMAILLHDCGMHLTQDGFRALVETDSPPLIHGLGDRPWKSLWVEFLAEASRFGEDKLIGIFGDTDPIDLSKLNLNNLSERDCLLGGEFVRRHHARLAHEIAIDRVPMSDKMGLEIIGLDIELRDLAGLIARSHGMAIRASFPYIEKKYIRLPEYRSIKVPFLMAVLRISDYVQVQSDRAIKSLLSIKELRSPISRQEWRNHFSVRDVTMRNKDPEAMFVHAAPTDVKTYLRLVSLFKDIQRELDESWATIGEVYGRLGDLSSLGINIRRIKSNLEDTNQFASTVQYIPRHASFSSSGPELLKLLVGPLYNYNYKTGIRELIQNAVDACKERHDLVSSGDGEVLVEIDESIEGTGWITVTDTGVGMALDTVIKYFLIAGASFRNSDLWKKQHTDTLGRTKVLRGGRFGVGALAAFLLGDEITVKTRHIHGDEMDGIEFSAKIDDPVIELKKSKVPSGTSIRVWVSQPDAMKALRPQIDFRKIQKTNEKITLESWDEVDWFAQDHPRVKYTWTGFAESNNTNSPDEKSRIRAEFHPTKNIVPIGQSETWTDLIDPKQYKRIAWQYPPIEEQKTDNYTYQSRGDTHIVVNGIRVMSWEFYRHVSLYLSGSNTFEAPSFNINRPSMAIYDPSGICPINLQRSAVAFDRMGIDDQIGREIIQAFLQDFFKDIPSKLTISSFIKCVKIFTNHIGLRFNDLGVEPLCATREGITLVTPRILENLKISRIIFIDSEADSNVSLQTLLQPGDCLAISNYEHNGIQSQLSWFRAIYTEYKNNWPSTNIGLQNISHKNEFGIIPKDYWDIITSKNKVSKIITQRLTPKSFNKNHVFLSSNNSDQETIELNFTSLKKIHQKIGIENNIHTWKIDYSTSKEYSKSPLTEEWERLLHGPIIKIS